MSVFFLVFLYNIFFFSFHLIYIFIDSFHLTHLVSFFDMWQQEHIDHFSQMLEGRRVEDWTERADTMYDRRLKRVSRRTPGMASLFPINILSLFIDIITICRRGLGDKTCLRQSAVIFACQTFQDELQEVHGGRACSI